MRPIEKKYLRGDTGEGGEGVASVTVNDANSYSSGTTISFAASPIGGDTATATIAFVAAADSAPGNGNVSGVTVTSAGTGYTSAPTITFNKPANVVVDGFTQIAGKVFKFSSGVTSGIYPGMVANAFFGTTTLGNPTRVVSVDVASGNITMSTANTAAISSPISFGDVGRGGALTAVLYSPSVSANTIQANAWTTTASMGLQSDINKQEGSRQYYVVNSADSNARVRLVPTGTNGVNSPTIAAVTAAGGPTQAGECTIQATDSDGGTYWVIKLEHAATIVSGGTGTPGTQFADYSQVVWTLDSPTAGVSVQLANNA